MVTFVPVRAGVGITRLVRVRAGIGPFVEDAT